MAKSLASALALALLSPLAAHAIEGVGDESAVDFSQDIAPIIEQHCIQCHQPLNNKGDLSLATFEDLSDNEYVISGKADESYLVEVITSSEGEPPLMPKKGEPLSDKQIDLIRRWVNQGAHWPKDFVVRDTARADRSWWSLRKIAEPDPPTPEGIPPLWQANPIDRFIYAKLAEKDLQPNPPAERRTLIRRLTYDLIGLPPTPEEVEAFVKDTTSDAYERLVDRLLASPRYGEQWGRHWLDVVRFGESRGFERNEIINNAWPFRDYVIRSFNDDKPFDQFVLEHLAGDMLDANNIDVAVGETFLVAGPYDDVGNQDAAQSAVIRANTIDEIIRTTSEGFLALTVGCARCHNHKFDPLLQTDYYGLYATFAGVRHGSRQIASEEEKQARTAKLAPLEKTRRVLQEQKTQLEGSVAARAEKKKQQYAKQWTRPRVDRYGTEEIFEPVTARYLKLTSQGLDSNPYATTGFRIDEFEVWTADGGEPRNVASTTSGGSAQGASRIAQDFADAYSATRAIDGKFSTEWISSGPELKITFAKPETINRVYFSSDRTRALGPTHGQKTFVGEYLIEVSQDGNNWIEVANSHDRQPVSEEHGQARIIRLETTPEESVQLAELREKLTAVEREIDKVPSLPSWWVGKFEDAKGPFHVFLGGDPQREGELVSAASLAALDDLPSKFKLPEEAPQGERRLAFANWIVAPDNPLTLRVLANRIWHYHFGTGVVDTPSDFGYMGSKPTHPALLDWMARYLLSSRWKWKPLHKLIVMSQTYRQSAAYDADSAQVDANDRLLWRFPPQRLAGEEVRDAILQITATLDTTMGGPGFRLYHYIQDNVATYVPLEKHGPETYRRAVYHQNARAARIDILSDFDCPDPAFPAPRRTNTTTPLQALTLMNHSFTLDMSAAFAKRVEREAGQDVSAQVRRTFLLAYSRLPQAQELSAATTLVNQHGLTALCRAIINSNEFIYRN